MLNHNHELVCFSNNLILGISHCLTLCSELYVLSFLWMQAFPCAVSFLSVSSLSWIITLSLTPHVYPLLWTFPPVALPRHCHCL